MQDSKKLALVFYYSRKHRYSINALLGAIEQDEELKTINTFLFDNTRDLLSGLNEIQDAYKKVILGISFFTTELWDIIELVKSIKRTAKNTFLIAGGPHPSGDPEGTLKIGFDVVVKGEGEETFKEILKKFLKEKDFKEVKGIYYLENGKPHFTGARTTINLDLYFPFSLKHAKFGPIEITRGCMYGCYYCQTPRIFGAKLRHRSKELVWEYVKLMKSRGMKDVRFITPSFFNYGASNGDSPNLEIIEELLSGIRGILKDEGKIFAGTFPSEVRPEHVTPRSLSILKKYTNNNNIIIGMQSGSDRILNLIHRKHTVEDGIRAVRYTIEMGLTPKVDFLFGLPFEEEEDQFKSMEVMKKLIEMGAVIHAHTFLPLTGTPFSKYKPSKLSPKLKDFLNYYSSKGRVFGDWREQEKLGLKISEYGNS
ncbi:MAG: TIGR04013 family B12-binding domain/radical SAM domain-containing protein [bacterium]|nr:TIGR04013 family B12-binding domain/radical SAM domain-containing protein [bacterium]